jgi:hypothetical protein
MIEIEAWLQISRMYDQHHVGRGGVALALALRSPYLDGIPRERLR